MTKLYATTHAEAGSHWHFYTLQVRQPKMTGVATHQYHDPHLKAGLWSRIWYSAPACQQRTRADQRMTGHWMLGTQTWSLADRCFPALKGSHTNFGCEPQYHYCSQSSNVMSRLFVSMYYFSMARLMCNLSCNKGWRSWKAWGPNLLAYSDIHTLLPEYNCGLHKAL